MTLEIRNDNNYFKLKGILNKRNLAFFKAEIDAVFETFNAITLNIEDLVGIDRHGVKAISELQNQALANNKRLSVIGLGNNKVYSSFKAAEKVA